MRYKVETYRPYSAPQVVTAEELPRLFSPDREPVFSYGEGGDVVLIVSVHDTFSTASLLHELTWYWLEESPDSTVVAIQLCGQEAWIPAGAMVRHEITLAALLQAHSLSQVLADFAWRQQ